MPLANIFLPYPGEEGWQTFWFNNWQDHWAIQEAILKQKSVNQFLYVINPWDDGDANGILQRHQQFHNDMNLELGINGSDLSQLDLKNPQSVRAWCWLHFYEHNAAHQILGI